MDKSKSIRRKSRDQKFDAYDRRQTEDYFATRLSP